MDDLVTNMKERLERIPGLAGAILFGSRAGDRPRPDSDLDVALLMESTDSMRRLQMLKTVAVELADLAPEGRVDVVFLDEAPDLLRQRVFERGRSIFCRNDGLWKRLRLRTMREFGDGEPYRRMLREGLIRSLRKGAAHGGSRRGVKPAENAGTLSGPDPEVSQPITR